MRQDIVGSTPVAPELDLESVIGLDSAVTELRESIVESAVGDVPDGYRTLSGMVYGPHGSGKQRLVRAVVGELVDYGYSYHRVDSLDQADRPPAEALDRLFDYALEDQPSVLVLDCFDEHHIHNDTVRTIRTRLDAARDGGDDIVVLSPISQHQFHQGSVQMYLRSVGVIIELERPDIDRRAGILEDRLQAVSERVDGVEAEGYEFDRLARETTRFGVDDLEKVARRAAVTATTDTGVEPPLTEADIVATADKVDEERLERIQDEATLTDVDVPTLTFDDVGGHEEVKQKLVQHVEQALDPDLEETLDMDIGGGVLLHGPPGTGKTMLIRALANELEYTFIPVTTPALKSGRGGPASQIPGLFYRAQRNTPAILFFDEFDSLGTRRGTTHADESAVNTLLTELDGLQQHEQLVVIAATNRPETLDPALLRPGRFDYHLEVGPPDVNERAAIFERHTTEFTLASDVTPGWFADLIGDATGADIAAVCERVVAIATDRAEADIEPSDLLFTQDDFERAYREFETGRLYRGDFQSSPAFQ